jgi:hypothetical protein
MKKAGNDLLVGGCYPLPHLRPGIANSQGV